MKLLLRIALNMFFFVKSENPLYTVNIIYTDINVQNMLYFFKTIFIIRF